MKSKFFLITLFFLLLLNPLSTHGNTHQNQPASGTGNPPVIDGGQQGTDPQIIDGGHQGSDSSGRPIKLENPLGSNIGDIPSLVRAILDIALKIGVPLIALAIIYSGFKFVMAQGNKDKLKEAKDTLLYVIIGSAILLGAYAIAEAIVSTISDVRG